MKSNNKYHFDSDQIKTLCQLDSSSVCFINYIDCFFVNNFESDYFLVLEYFVYETLANEIMNNKLRNSFAQHDIEDWLNQLLIGIDFLHRNNIIHYNIIPEFVYFIYLF